MPKISGARGRLAGMPMTGKLDGQRIAAGGLAAAILDSAHALVVTLDIEGRITGFNRACELLSGYKADEVIGTPIWDKLLPKEAAGPIRQFFAGLPEGREVPEEHENAWLTRDGRRPIIAWNNSVMRNAAGEIDAIVGIGVDITERKAANDRLARAQRIAQIGSWERTVGTNEENWSDQFFINLGLEPGSVKPSVEEFYRHVHPGDHSDIRRKIQNTVTTKQTYSADFRVIWPDGTERLVHEQAEPILDNDGKVFALAGTMQDITELRETENRLQRLTHSFANAQRMAGIGNWDWDAITKVEWWSDEIYRILGLEPGAIEPGYDSFMSRTHPDDREKVGQAIETAQRQLTSYDITFRVITPDGNERVVREVSECVLDSLGRLAGLSGTVQDITAQYSAEQALADTAKRLEGAIRLVKLGSWEWDPGSNLLKNSPETLRICGLNPDSAEVDNEFLMAMIPVEEHASVLGKMNNAVSSGLPYTNEYHIVRPDGDIRTVLEHGEPYHDEATGRTRLVGTIQDITERKRAEEELARTVKRLADAQTAAQIGNWEWDATTDRDWWSEQQFRNYGIEAPAGFVHGDYYLEFAHPADREAAKRTVDRSNETGTPLDLEFRATGADGVDRMLWVYGTAETDADGNVIRAVGTTQDITARKYAEMELLQTTERLKEAQRIGNIGSWLWDLCDNSEKWSDQSYVIHGLEPGEITIDGDTYLRFVHPDDRERVRLAHERSAAEKNPLSVEYRCIDARGVEKVIQATGECRFDRGGDLVAMAGTIQDITDRKRAETVLAKTAARLAEAHRVAHLGHWEWLPESTSTLWSDQMFRIFGMEPGEIEPTQESFFRMVHADDREIVSRIMARTVETGEPYEIEFRVIRVDGVLRYIFERGERYIDEETGKSSVRGVTQDITERKQFELSLRHTMDRLEEAQRLAHVGHWEWDPVANHSIWSDENYRIFGLSPGASARPPTHDAFMAIVHPEDREALEGKMATTLETGEAYTAEFRIVRNTGEIRTIFERGERFMPEGSSGFRIRGVLQDITEQKTAEEELRETANRLERSQRAGKVGSWVWEIGEDKEWWSDEIYRMFGMEIGEVVLEGYGFLDYVHPDDRDRVRAIQDKSLNEGAPYNAEYRLRRVDGREIIISEHGEMEHDAQGRPLRMRGIAQDITERKAAEEKIRETAEYLKETQRIAKLGSWVWEIAEDKEWWSDEIYRMMGQEPGSTLVSGYDYLKYVHPDDRERVRTTMERSLREQVPYVTEFRIHRADGQVIVVSEHAETEYDETGRAIRMRGSTQDITELKQIEQELARLNAELEQRVEDRTAELRAAQAELVKNERLATLGQLTATVSHELRNPLGAMRTSMYVVEKKTDAEDQRLRASIDRVNRNITRCDQIIDELLDYTRIRDLDLRQTDLDRWLGAILDEQDTPSKVTVKRKFGTKGARIPFDSDRLRRAIVNVFENACHAAAACAHRKALVSIETSLRKDRVQITVSDNGAGIPPEIREKIFEPLFSTKNFGVGLGLPTVRQIMEQHGGGIEIGEGRDGGAKFALWLPLAEEPEIADK